MLAYQLVYILFLIFISKQPQHPGLPQRTELEIVHDLFRLRNEHKADSAEKYFADTVAVYMKFLRNVPKQKVTQSDKQFWKAHPQNKFEITAPVKIVSSGSITIATIYGKEYLDGMSFQKERIEIRFNRQKKIYYYRGYLLQN